MWGNAIHISTVNGSASPLQASDLSTTRHPKLTPHTHGDEAVVRPSSRSSAKTAIYSSRMRISHHATVVRRSIRLKRKKLCVIPGNKPIISRLKRERAIHDLGETEPCHRALKREDSFVLVDHGNHFQMVKPMYAKLYYEPVPKSFDSTASFHAFGKGVDDESLRKKLLR